MKIALVCDDLIYHGGHENVIKKICEIFPDAPLYTTYISKIWKDYCQENNIKVISSFLQKFPLVEKLNKYYAPFLLHILALESFNFDEYDVVLSISSRFCHGIITKPKTLHICYMSTMGRMFWEPFDYFEYEKSGLFNLFKKLANTFLMFPISYIRLWDKAASGRVDFFVANSITTQKRIKKYYNRESEIIYPFVDIEKIRKISENYELTSSDEYFVVLSRLVAWKRIDIAILACGELGKKLKIIGTGPDLERLKKLASTNKDIEFTGYVSFEKKIEILTNCAGFINTQKEDFGITILEALACGKPVIAYNQGGAAEIIVQDKTGEFFETQEKDSLKEILSKFDILKYDKKICIDSARNYDQQVFIDKLKNYITLCKGEYDK